MKLTRSIMVIPVAALLMTGCATTDGYQKPISDFQNASSIVTQSAGVYVTQLNKTQRDAYITRQVSGAEPIKLSEIERLQVFSPEGLAARLGALDKLSKYGELLGQLANSDAPQRVSSNAQGLAASLNKLSEDINKLSASKDAKFKEAFGLAALLIGEVARFSVEKKIQEALDKAILDGEKPVTNLIRRIRADLELAYELKRNALSENRVIYVDGYERERSGVQPNLLSLRNRGEEIKAALDLWEALPVSNPSQGLDAMATAHGDLVDYAKSPKRAENLAALASQMEIFAARAKRVGNAVQQLQQLTK